MIARVWLWALFLLALTGRISEAQSIPPADKWRAVYLQERAKPEYHTLRSPAAASSWGDSWREWILGFLRFREGAAFLHQSQWIAPLLYALFLGLGGLFVIVRGSQWWRQVWSRRTKHRALSPSSGSPPPESITVQGHDALQLAWLEFEAWVRAQGFPVSPAETVRQVLLRIVQTMDSSPASNESASLLERAFYGPTSPDTHATVEAIRTLQELRQEPPVERR